MKKLFLITFSILSALCVLRFTIHDVSAQQPPRMRINNIEMNSVYGQSFKTLSNEKQKETEVNYITTNDYRINFYPLANTFTITILNPDFETVRRQAEQALINKLGIEDEQACFLTIRVGTPAFVNPVLAEKDYPVSFCDPKVRADVNKDKKVDDSDIAICTNPKESTEDCDFNLDDHINALDYSYILQEIFNF